MCSGTKVQERAATGRSITRWSSPRDKDIVIVASPNFQERLIHESGTNLEIYYTQLPEAFLAQEDAQIAGVPKLFSGRLGETNIPGGTVKHVYSTKRKGQGKAGFARPGLIVTSEGLTIEALARNPIFSLFQGIVHEIAHVWWNFGAGPGGRINEAFAEYFSAVAVQEVVWDEEFRKVMADHGKQAGELAGDAAPLSTVRPMGQTSS